MLLLQALLTLAACASFAGMGLCILIAGTLCAAKATLSHGVAS